MEFYDDQRQLATWFDLASNRITAKLVIHPPTKSSPYYLI